MGSDLDFTPIATGIYLEALAVDGDTVWVGDVIGGGIRSIAPRGRPSTTLLPELRFFSAFALNEDGLLLRGGVDGLGWFDPASGRTGMVVTSVSGIPLMGVNELCPDGRGGLYFGSKDGAAIMRGGSLRPTGLYHVAADGSVRQLCDGLTFTNGIALSADGRTLFHNETFAGTFAYPILADGGLGDRTMLLQKDDCDGMVLDTQGNLWVVGYTSSKIIRLSPEGEILGELSIPDGAVTNLRFGGDGRDLYITSVPFSAGSRIRDGAAPTEQASVLYHVRVTIEGRPQARTNLVLR